MKKWRFLYLILLVLSIGTASCTGDKGHPSPPENQIRTATAESVSLKDEDGELVAKEPDTIYKVAVYDRYGYQIGVYSYNSLEDEWLCETDSDGNISEFTILHNRGADSYVSTRVFCKYNAYGHLIELVTYTPQRSPYEWKQTLVYNQDGALVESSSYDEEDSLQGKVVHDYDTEGNEILEVSYDSSGSPNRKLVREYDDTGNVIKEDWYFALANDGSLELQNTIMKQYDHDGNALKRTSYNSEGSLELQQIYTYLEYDEYGNWTVRQLDKLQYFPSLSITQHQRTIMTYTYYHEVGVFA